ncbi:hypothetical protein GCM10007423_32350 [Dyadobacter endophyticus]|uniref:Uncharacterized protein n=1 Tax=Dyadobacter endophyticus TaxID=1749036 RepID=A0ABQ1YUV8_9BACT|nr:hypothetical protein GCM10007423_32350 [Dyadobacter endophyticus]
MVCKLGLQTNFTDHEKTFSIVTAGDVVAGRKRGGAVAERDCPLGYDNNRQWEQHEK